MRKRMGIWIVIAAAITMLLGGCSSSETTGLCENIVTARASRFYFSPLPNSSVRVITSQHAERLCPAELGIKVRYESDDLAFRIAPQNISVEFAVEDGSGNPATIFPAGDPEYTTLYQRRYVQWAVSVNAADRVEPVYYFIRIRTDGAGDSPVLADAVIRYTLYETPTGLLH